MVATFFRSSSYGHRSFSVAGYTMWHSLPRHLPDSVDITAGMRGVTITRYINLCFTNFTYFEHFLEISKL